MQSDFQVTVIIPVFNGEKYLGQAIDSVLNQSEPPLEVIVVDDGSTDESAAAVRAYGDQVQYAYQDNAGAAAARNRGVQGARGDYLAFLDADDFWVLHKLKRQKELLAENPSLDMVFGWIQQFYSPETDEAFRNLYTCPPEPSRGAHPGTMLIKKNSFLQAGFFSTAYQTGEFIEWYARASEQKLKAAVMAEVLMHRRIHPDNHGITHKEDTRDYARIVKEMLQRRKADRGS